MSQQRQFHMVGAGNNFNGGQFMMNNDTTYTKLFVGGLAWETQRDTMKRYFEQFGEILEAVVITDKSTGRSKGYGFVTFKDPESAFRACQNPSPVIDGRRANCNLACLGAQKNRPSNPQHGSSSSTFFPQASPQVSPFPYSPYGYSGYTHDTMYHMNYYGMYGQHLSPYYTTSGGAGVGGYMGNYYPYYTNPYAQMQMQMQLQSSQATATATATATAPGFGVQFSAPFTHSHHMLQQQQQQHYSVAVSLPQQFMSTNTSGLLSLPPPTMALPTPTTSAITPGVTTIVGSGPSKTPTTGAASEQNSST